ncbi:hypothetical protein E3N88_18211 [Mikania micrantha]|uniref:CoA carboxyltransferase N-terminal domain-containing protein n=1 Tax=Mikania micrantha TaxID=192012 RepID=A0A5N6NWA2_9ASTR|nr:hypothetical protein E3N88_18211 [Mikania micrantha]
MPLGTAIHNIEITLGKGGQLARAAGAVAKLIAKEGKSATLKLLLGSGNSSKNADARTSDQIIRESSTDLDVTQKYRHLWVQCENCYGLNYKKFFKSKMNLCEQCGYHLKMSGSDRIELSIDPGTWEPMDEDMVSLDPIEFHSEEEPYKNRIDSYQRKTGLTEAVQTGIGQLDGINVAIAVMDFQFMGENKQVDDKGLKQLLQTQLLTYHSRTQCGIYP